MKNPGFIFPFFLLGLFLAGCSYDEGPIPSDEEALNAKEEAVFKGSKKHAVPFKSNFECWSIDFFPDGEVADKYHQVLEGSGNASHMGKAKMEIPDELLYTADFVDWTATADVILTAANGDKLFFSYASAFIYKAETHVIGHGPITGGTGRFDGASGWMTYEGLWTETGKVTFTGHIKY